MARFTTDGLDDLIQQLDAMGNDVAELAEEMLFAGAEEVAEAWRKSAEQHGHRDTGEMIKAIGYPRTPRRVGDIKAIDIYPIGTEPDRIRKKASQDREGNILPIGGTIKGKRHAEKAFQTHYGTSKHPGSHWVDDADDMAGPMVEKRLWEIYDDWLRDHGM